MISETLFKLAALGYTVTIQPMDQMRQVLGISISKDGYVNRALVTKTKHESGTEILVNRELNFLEHSFDGLAVKEEN